MKYILVPQLIRRSRSENEVGSSDQGDRGGLEKELAGLGKNMVDYKDKERRRKPTNFKFDE